MEGDAISSRRVWIDPHTGLPLPEPYPDYVKCPHCGEAEVEVWCFMSRVQCHRCGEWIDHQPPDCLGSSPACQGCVAQKTAVG